jgi:hypothetical protein
MSSTLSFRHVLGTVSTLGVISAASLLTAAPAFAQSGGPSTAVYDLTRTHLPATTSDTVEDENGEKSYSFTSRADSIAWARSKGVAERARGFRLVVSLQDRHLWAIVGEDTVLSAPVAVAKGTSLKFGDQSWRFITPRGVRTVLGKESDPVWQPPEWLYAETASEYGLKLAHLSNTRKTKLSDGRYLAMQGGVAGVIDNGQWAALPTDEHIVFDNTLFVPPLGSKNRKVEGELGKYRLNMGDGFLLHGTPHKESIGMAATHGCVRMRDEDIEWLYEHVPVGTKVYIY